jgi:hypothetical protein
VPLFARLPLHALVIDSEAGSENLRVHEVIGAPVFTSVYEPTNPEPQSEVLANVAVTGEGAGVPVPPEPVPPEPVPVEPEPPEPVPPEPVPPEPVPPVGPEQGCPLSVHWVGATKPPVYVVWNPKVALPPVDSAPFHEAFVTVYVVPTWERLPLHELVTVSVLGSWNVNVQLLVGAPPLTML